MIGSLRLTLPDHTIPGITCIEAFAFFEVRGGRVHKQHVGHTAKTEMNIREALHLFQDFFRYIIENCAQKADRHLFQATKAKQWRLRPLQFEHSSASSRGLPKLDKKETLLTTMAMIIVAY